MIVYRDILRQLSDAGWSAYRLSKERILSNSTIQRLRDGGPISTDTVDIICSLLECQPNDIMEHKRDEE